MESVSDRLLRKSKHILCAINFFMKTVPFMR